MKRIHFTLLMILVVFVSCHQTDSINNADLLTMEEEQVIVKEVSGIMNETISGINNLNVDSVFSNINRMEFSRFINNGLIFENYDSTYTTFKNIYGQLKKLNVVLTQENYKVMSVNAVLFTAGFIEDLYDPAGNISRNQGAMSCVFEKTNDTWEIIHVHQSFFPITENK